CARSLYLLLQDYYSGSYTRVPIGLEVW
nr:immunoglobulin heavy chain junction region [Macaca mulatta]MOW98743.1 immunoglobulin heavy chain junction region [Macaca mulatta]MOX00345.1 immunoglobulin heavy chain junction region [Macaca mulatta]MOX02199.1 immunoglobulin heavy chain junction region [Macaca mulatta]MOX03064.1 immunoglobulin heavy chain junction region [Macaca mulatta]